MGIAERKNREKQALRERILDAARRIVIRDGFAALSMRKIADAIEYSPATLYLHFESRDEIARALCMEGYKQLLDSLAPCAQLADPGERLRALAHAYVAFGREHAQTYRLIFMEDPSYTGAAFAGGAARESGEADDAAFRLFTDSLDELKTAGRVPAGADSAWAEALWATLHGIVALSITCPVFPRAPLDSVVDVALDAWFGPRDVPRRERNEARESDATDERGGKPVGAGHPAPPAPAAPAAAPVAPVARTARTARARAVRKPKAAAS